MTQFTRTQFSFAGGIFSPSMYGRSDIQRWESAVATLENFVARPEGPAQRRSGTRFVDGAFDESKKTALLPFIFSNEDAYVFEMSEKFTRIFTDEGIVLDTGQLINSVIGTHAAIVSLQAPPLRYTASTAPMNIINVTGPRMQDDGIDIQDDDVFFIGDATYPAYLVFRDAAFTIQTILTGPNDGSIIKFDDSSFVGYGFGTPYLADELCDVRIAQSADVVYMAQEDHPPQKVSRFGPADFTIEDFVFINGPYRDENVDDNETMFVSTIHSGALDTLGADISITHTGATIHDFDAGRDVGRSLRVFIDKTGTDPEGYVGIEITSVTSLAVVRGILTLALADDTPPTAPTDATTKWSLGLQIEAPATPTDAALPSVIGGFPRTVSFHQQRLCFGGSPEFPENVWMSRTGRFDDFSAFTDDNQINDDDAITLTLSDNTVNAIRWMKSNRVLVVGTNGGIYNIDSDRAGDALTANAIRSIRVNQKPAGNAEAEVFESINAYISLTRGKVRGSQYDLGDDTYQSDDLSIFSDSVLASGAEQLTYTDEPHSQLHVRVGDGSVAALSFIGAQEVQGWNTYTVAGTFQSGPAFIESFTSIPSPNVDLVRTHGANTQYNQVWVVVRRTIDGVDRRYIEFFEEDFVDNGDLEDAFFVDSGLSLGFDRGLMGAATNANPCVVTIPLTHGFNNGVTIKITHVEGMTELNGPVFTVANKTATTLELAGVDSTNFGVYTGGGEVRFAVNTISGLDHLEGETVQIVADGTFEGTQTVVSGDVTLSQLSSEVHVGLGYTSVLEQLPFDQANQQGSGMGKIKRVTHADVRLKDTVGGKVGVLGGRQEALKDRVVGDILDETTGLATGWVRVSIDQGYTTEGRVAVTQDEPMPMTVVAISRQGETPSR